MAGGRRAATPWRPRPAPSAPWPVPAWPLNVLPYVFVGALVVGVVGFAVLRVRKPEVAERAGTFADDLD
ncbi:hypothetical protein PUR32_13090 [Streptomyces sp. BE133]|nr:hypothetical protein [Streptomyces sp. BE133]